MAKIRLYALCDQAILDERGVSIDEFIEIAKRHNAEIIQYRNKDADISFIKKQLIHIRKNYNGFLIVNDRYELVEFCDGVHVGQEDLMKIDKDTKKAMSVIRSVIQEDKILGLSTHNEEEVLSANEMNVNYIGLGAYRDTRTKKVTDILGENLDNIASKSKHLVAAIGGVKMNDRFENITYHVIGSGLL